MVMCLLRSEGYVIDIICLVAAVVVYYVVSL